MRGQIINLLVRGTKWCEGGVYHFDCMRRTREKHARQRENQARNRSVVGIPLDSAAWGDGKTGDRKHGGNRQPVPGSYSGADPFPETPCPGCYARNNGRPVKQKMFMSRLTAGESTDAEERVIIPRRQAQQSC